MKKAIRSFMSLVVMVSLFALAGCAGSKPAATGDTTASGTTVSHSQAINVIKNAPVYFAFDRYDLDSAAKADLQAKADLLKAYTDIKVQIEGHCDARGTDEYNLALGERRARASYDYLLMLGVKPAQLSTHSYGKLYPAVNGSGETAWSKNRRDEFNVSYQD